MVPQAGKPGGPGVDDGNKHRRGGTAPAPLRAVVADDETLLREGLASLLDRSGFTVVGQVGNAVELLALVRKTQPRCRWWWTSGCRPPTPPRVSTPPG